MTLQEYGLEVFTYHLNCQNLSNGCRDIGLLTHWGRVTHICIVNLIIIDSDNGLSPGQHQTLTNAELLLILPLGTNFGEILIKILTVSLKKMCLKWSSAKWRPFCLGLNVLTYVLLWYVGLSLLDDYSKKSWGNSGIYLENKYIRSYFAIKYDPHNDIKSWPVCLFLGQHHLCVNGAVIATLSDRPCH